MTDNDFEIWYYTDDFGLPFWKALSRFPALIERCKSAIEYCSSQGWDIAELAITEDEQIVVGNYAVVLEPYVPANDVKELAHQLFESSETVYNATGE